MVRMSGLPAASQRSSSIRELGWWTRCTWYMPLLLGSGERLFDNLEDVPSGYEVAEFVGTPTALHVRVVRSA